MSKWIDWKLVISGVLLYLILVGLSVLQEVLV